MFGRRERAGEQTYCLEPTGNMEGTEAVALHYKAQKYFLRCSYELDVGTIAGLLSNFDSGRAPRRVHEETVQ